MRRLAKNKVKQPKFSNYKEFLIYDNQKNPSPLQKIARKFDFGQKIIEPYLIDCINEKLKIVIESEFNTHVKDKFLENLGYTVYHVSNELAKSDKEYLTKWFTNICKVPQSK